MSASYTFLPWIRRGLGNKITQEDTLEINDPTSSTDRPVVSVVVKLSDASGAIHHTLNKPVKLLGPGDVVGFNPNLVIKVTPQNNTSDFEPNYLPCIEFYDEELPWRFSPANPNIDRLRPWMFLLTLKEDEFILNAPTIGALTSITLKAVIDLPLSQSWAWAHVHINSTLKSSNSDINAVCLEVDKLLKENPDLAYSRILSPRRLETNTKYYAFLIPYFESGRNAGLGVEKPYENVNTQEAITLTEGSKHPVYFSWSFATSAGGDFEALLRRLQPFNAADLKLPELDISDLASEFKKLPFDDPTLAFSAALMPPGYKDTNWPVSGKEPDNIIKGALRERLNEVKTTNLTDDPIVNIPPMYGRWHAAIDELLGNNSMSVNTNVNPNTSLNSNVGTTVKKGLSTWISSLPKPWIYTLNLDPRYRAIAGLGTQVIQKNQEKFMDDAWEQVGSILEANQLMRQAQLAIEVNTKILEKHISNPSRTNLESHALSSTLHKKILAPQNIGGTFAQLIKGSKISPAGLDPAFKKIIRPSGKIARKAALINNSAVTPSNFRVRLVIDLDDNINPINQSIVGAPKKPKNFDFPNSTGFDMANLNSEETPIEIRLSTYITSANIVSPWKAGSIANNNSPSTYFTDSLKPENTLGVRILQRIPLQGKTLTNLKPIMAAPEFPYPMNEFLKSISGEYLIPGLSEFPNNSVTILEPNRPFIEAFMAGLNHEMARELLWREYPTDQRGSYFRQFWSSRDFIQTNSGSSFELTDISYMHTWSKQLGDHIPTASLAPGLVLIFRGDLFRKFPNTIIFAQKAEFSNSTPKKRKLIEAGDPAFKIKFPLNKSLVDPDINIVGFDLSPEEASGDNNDAGWFFVFQERLGEARFGLDDNQANTVPPLNWDGLDWAHVNFGTISINSNPLLNTPQNQNGIFWGKDAAHMAYILYQAPVMLAIHASDFMPPKPLPDTNADPTQIVYNTIG